MLGKAEFAKFAVKAFFACLLSFVSACSDDVAATTTIEQPSLTPSKAPTQTQQILLAPTITQTLPLSITPSPSLRPTYTAVAYPPPLSPPLPITHDLLWLDTVDGNLMRLNRLSGKIEILAGPLDTSLFQTDGPILEYQSGTNSGKVVLVVNAGLTMEGETVVELGVLDLLHSNFEVIQRFVEEFWWDDSLKGLSFSPDGKWIAYWFWKYDGLESSEHILYLLAGDGSEQPREVASCIDTTDSSSIPDCTHGSLHWAQNSQILAWSWFYSGIWMVKLGEEAKLVLPNFVTDEVTNTRYYSPVAFSPSGRFMLISAGLYEGGLLEVWDMQTGRIAEIEETRTFFYTPLTSVIWLDNARLLIVRSSDERDTVHPNGILKIFKVEPNDPELLELETVFDIPLPFGNYPFLPYERPDGQILIGLVDFDFFEGWIDPFERTGRFLAYDQRFGELTIVTEFPLYSLPFEYECYGYAATCGWAPDGSAVVFDWYSNQGIYKPIVLPLDGSHPFDLGGLESEDVCCFAWVE